MERVERLRQVASNFRRLAVSNSPPAMRRRLIEMAGKCEELARTIEETLPPSRTGPATKLVEFGTLTYDLNKEVRVLYVIDVCPGDQPSVLEVKGTVFPVNQRGDLADAMGKELIVKLRDGRRLRLSLTNAEGEFKGKGPIENV